MRHSPTPLVLTSFLVLLALAPAQGSDRLVLTSSKASSEFLQKRIVDGKPQPQKYVFMAGRYYSGNTRDKSLERISFRTVAERLALDLQKQDFYPAQSLANADLLLVVHWGVTAGRNRDSVTMALNMESLANLTIDGQVAQSNLEEATERGDLEGIRRAQDALTNAESETASQTQDLLRNGPDGGNSAILLGLNEALRKPDDTLFDYERRKTLFEMAQEECYFVAVIAYDARALVSSKKLKRAWTLRVSTSSAGVNFAEALDRFGNMAGRYSGTQLVGVNFEYPADRKRHERVELGDLIILGTVSPAP